MSSLPDIVRTTVVRRALLPAGAPVLVMVSGGGDSVALLHLLAAGTLGEHPVRALHVNHRLRGADADADQHFVEELCAALSIECEVERIDVGALAAEQRLNLEDAGRRVRRTVADAHLDAWCAELGVSAMAGRIAIAHTRDDRVETFLMRAAEGTATGGLASIRPASGRIVRPLIDADRADVRTWLFEEGLTWRDDATNDDMGRSRAYVRAEVVPALERLNPAVRANLARTMDLLADDDTLLSSMAAAFARDFSDHREDTGEVTFEVEWMATLDKTMVRRVIRTALVSAFPEASRIEAAHVEALADGLAQEGFARDIGEGLRAWREYGRLVVSCAPDDEPRVAPRLLSVPGSLEFAGGLVIATPSGPDAMDGSENTALIDAAAVQTGLSVGSAAEGERMRPLGMQGSRKLSDLLIDAKVARRHRARVPVVRDGERVVWLAGVRMSDEYKVTESTTEAIRLEWKPGRRREDEEAQADD